MRNFTVSSDISLFCRPEEIQDMYGEGIKDIEVIGWRWSEKLVERLKQTGLKVKRLHGRTGSELYAGMMDFMLMPLTTLVQTAKKHAVEAVLLHVNVAKRQREEILKECRGIELAIENSDIPGEGLEQAFEWAGRLKSLGVTTKVVGDIGHFGLEIGMLSNPDELMRYFLQQMTEYRNRYGVDTGAHLPINNGVDKGAVNLDLISDATLAEYLREFDDLVIENQINPIQALKPGHREDFRIRTQKKWKRIRELGP